MGDERREVPATVLAVVVGLLAGVGVGAVAVLAWVGGIDPEDPAPAGDESTLTGLGGPLGDSEPTADVPADSTMQRCVSAARALEAPLEAAGAALEQWGVHIQAMNDLVVGEINLQQAREFWDRTRVVARRRVDDYDSAWTAVRQEGVDCPSPRLAPPDPALRPCIGQVAARIRVLEAAATSIRMWDHHVRDMEMLRRGTLSPGEATAMWLATWQRGDRGLNAYREAARDERAHDGCLEEATSG
ncbi:hypothetical protein [Nocardioides xinjiangensis]|uniref:hypothetical protein n=1 Tax=Nocardioides xinjiangensis TaxID=2817376 RepID=UPI001B3150CF|nr:MULTISPECIES: hypothetical protein [unclassified Nocardioides]